MFAVRHVLINQNVILALSPFKCYENLFSTAHLIWFYGMAIDACLPYNLLKENNDYLDICICIAGHMKYHSCWRPLLFLLFAVSSPWPSAGLLIVKAIFFFFVVQDFNLFLLLTSISIDYSRRRQCQSHMSNLIVTFLAVQLVLTARRKWKRKISMKNLLAEQRLCNLSLPLPVARE